MKLAEAVTTPSIREQLIARIQEKLQLDDVTIHRERTRPIDEDSLPAILLYFEDEDPTPIGSDRRAPFVERSLALVVEYRAKGSSDVPPDAALDPLIVWTSKTLLQDETLGGLANGIQEGQTSWSSKEGDALIASASQKLNIRYRTNRLDPTSRT